MQYVILANPAGSVSTAARTGRNRNPGGLSLAPPNERKALAARDRAILWLLLSTGIRLSELCGLRFCDLD